MIEAVIFFVAFISGWILSSLWRRVNLHALKSTGVREQLCKICKLYSLNHQLYANGSVRVYRFKGNTIIYDKTFESIRSLRKAFPMRRVNAIEFR